MTIRRCARLSGERFGTADSIALISAGKSTGFSKYPLAPRVLQCSLNRFPPSPVTMKMGILEVKLKECRLRQSSKPVCPGMNKSSKMASGLFARTRPNASAGSPVSNSSYVDCNRSRIRLRSFGSSSITTTFFITFSLLAFGFLYQLAHSQRWLDLQHLAHLLRQIGACVWFRKEVTVFLQNVASFDALACITRGEKDAKVWPFFDEHLCECMPVDFGQNHVRQ